MQVILCYDISEDRRRAQMAREVVRHLDRVQKSTYEGDISAAAVAAIRRAAKAIIDPETDSVRIYRICNACHPRTEVIGTGVYVGPEDEDILL